MKVPSYPLLLLVLVASSLVACTNANEINASFRQNQVSWFVWDGTQPGGFRALPGFDQSLKVVWQTRPQAVFVTDKVPVPGLGGAFAVNRLGLVVLNDADGTLSGFRPGAQWPLEAYRTDRVFVWKGKVFLTLSQEYPVRLPPASLAWWEPGQPRLAPYPVPSQWKDPSRQAQSSEFLPSGDPKVVFRWKKPEGAGWAYDTTSLGLATGVEAPGSEGFASVSDDLDLAYATVRSRLAGRIGPGIPLKASVGPGPLVLFSEGGWVCVGNRGEARTRLYRLPELGIAGRYTNALALTQGYVFTWETSYRGYVGAAGLVHVPFSVLAP